MAQGFEPMVASEFRKRRIEGLKSSRWRWRLGWVFVMTETGSNLSDSTATCPRESVLPIRLR
jgi:hypothetical protein